MLEKEDLEPIFKAVVRDLQNQSERLAKIEAAFEKLTPQPRKRSAFEIIENVERMIDNGDGHYSGQATRNIRAQMQELRAVLSQ